MKTYKIKQNINFVIIDDKVVVLDFCNGEFYLLDYQFISFFKIIETKGRNTIFKDTECSKNLLLELCNNDIFEEIR